MAIERLTINLQSGVLADSYQIDQLFDEAIGTAHFGTICGWPAGCTVRAKSFNPASGRYSLQGDYDVSEKLKAYLNTDSTDAAGIMAGVAAQIGKTATVSIDSHSVKAPAENTTVMQALSGLFSWTSAVPHRFVNVFLRGGVIYVLQRGKESATYVPVKYSINSTAEKLLDTLMDVSTDNPVIMGDAPEPLDNAARYYSGTFLFGQSVVTFSNGLNIYTSDSSDGITRSTTTSYAYDRGKPYVKSAITRTDGETTETLNNTYSDYDQQYYLSRTVRVAYREDKQTGSTVDITTATSFFPLGMEKYGAREITTSSNNTVTSDRTWISEGRPGSPASQWALDNAQLATAAPSVSVDRNPISSAHIPVTDETTLQRYANGLEWLDGKTEYSLKMDCYDQSIIDFDKTVTVAGHVWYLQSNQITIGPSAAVKQSIELLRWA